ncbi:MAG: hypothetical protein H7831_00925 [Magnetococcus sp. WYHC-3]
MDLVDIFPLDELPVTQQKSWAGLATLAEVRDNLADLMRHLPPGGLDVTLSETQIDGLWSDLMTQCHKLDHVIDSLRREIRPQ